MKQTLFYTQTINDLFTHADLVLNLTKILFFVYLTTLPDFPLKKTVDTFHNDFGGIEFQSPLVSIQRRVIVLESWWCAELLFALFLLSWMSKGVRGKGEVTS